MHAVLLLLVAIGGTFFSVEIPLFSWGTYRSVHGD
jgi:hypothetical protein